MNLMRIAIVAGVFVSIVSPALALEAAEPGKSLWGFKLGTSRKNALTAAKKRWPEAKQEKPHNYKSGLTEDEWTIPLGQETLIFEILSKGDKIVQLTAKSTEEHGPTNLSFAQLLKRHRLKKSVYGFDYPPEGGGYDCFYYDDVKRGVCFALGVQDNFLLTYRPDELIVHKPGVPVIAIFDGVIGKKVTGRNARAFANQAEADRVEQREMNDY